MGDEDKPKNPLDEFWAQLGDKEKQNVRSYRPSKRDIQVQEDDAGTTGRPRANSRKRWD